MDLSVFASVVVVCWALYTAIILRFTVRTVTCMIFWQFVLGDGEATATIVVRSVVVARTFTRPVCALRSFVVSGNLHAYAHSQWLKDAADVRGKTRRVAHPAQTRQQYSGLLDQRSTNFYRTQRGHRRYQCAHTCCNCPIRVVEC